MIDAPGHYRFTYWRMFLLGIFAGIALVSGFILLVALLTNGLFWVKFALFGVIVCDGIAMIAALLTEIARSRRIRE